MLSLQFIGFRENPRVIFSLRLSARRFCRYAATKITARKYAFLLREVSMCLRISENISHRFMHQIENNDAVQNYEIDSISKILWYSRWFPNQHTYCYLKRFQIGLYEAPFQISTISGHANNLMFLKTNGDWQTFWWWTDLRDQNNIRKSNNSQTYPLDERILFFNHD